MRFPTLDHVFYIPLVLAAGAILGYWWGRRALTIQLAEEERAQRLRADRRAQRRADATKITAAQGVQTAADDNDDDEGDSVAP